MHQRTPEEASTINCQRTRTMPKRQPSRCRPTRTRVGIALALVAAVLLPPAGCGRIAEPDNIRVAKIGDEYITRGDLFELLRDMEDAQRPKIRHKGDLLRVLNEYIDNRLKIPVGQQLAAEGKIKVPRETAREQFFQERGDQQDMWRSIWSMEVPPPGQSTPLMEVYDLTPASISSMKSIVEDGTDAIERKLLGDQALLFLAAQAVQAGEITLDDEALEQEYRLRKDELKRLEWLKFRALRFPTAVGDALERAAGARSRIDAGESFDTVLDEYAAHDPQWVIESEIENNPTLTRFRGFWVAASGAEAGDILGPVYLPSYQQVAQDTQGRMVSVPMPDAYLVLKVLEHHPESALTIDEARPMLAAPLLVAQGMKRLRAQHGVEIYEDKLPDPLAYSAGPR